MGRKNKSLMYRIRKRYDEMLAIGQSKRADKAAGITLHKIYSWETYKSYIKHSQEKTRLFAPTSIFLK